MGRIVSNFFMSLDGVVEAPDQWHMPYFNDEMGDAIGKGMATNKAFLMGRVLYDEWAGARLFEDDTTRALELAGHQVFSTGVLNLTYAPAVR